MINHQIITSLLDLDWYKLTMGSFIHDYLGQAKLEVTFVLFDREKFDYDISRHALIEQLNATRALKFTRQELHYLRGFGMFNEEYLDFLSKLTLPEPFLHSDGTISVKGKWEEVTYWETLLMSIVNEMISLQHIPYDQMKDRRYLALQYVKFCEKIDMCESNGIKFSDFGTRRRASKAWQHCLIESLVEHKTQGFLGTSNVALAMEFGISPIGTMAHELFMVTTAPDINPKATNEICKKWNSCTRFPKILLTDTYTTPWFFNNIDEDIIRDACGFRWDSGDPDIFTDQVLAYLQERVINPKYYKIIYSDRMTAEKMVRLHKKYSPVIQTAFGWGTDLTNPNPTGLICKAMKVDEWGTVKLSDDPKKALGNKCDEYRQKLRI